MEWIFALILAHAPWHDAYTLGQRASLPGSYSVFGTWAGLANLLAFSFLLVAISLSQINTRLKPILLGICITPFFFFLINTSDWNKAAVQTFMGLFSLGLLLYISRLEQAQRKNHFQKLFFIFFFSYLLAIVLPFVIRIPGYGIFQLFYTTLRYRGWVGEGQPIGFCGMTLSIWGAVFFLSANESQKKRAWGTAAILLGTAGIFLNVLRIALLGTSIFFLFLALQGLLAKAHRQFKLGIFGLLLCTLIFSTPQIRNKNKMGYREAHGTYHIASINNLPSFARTLIREGFVEITQVEKVVVTNGRAETYKMVYSHFKGHEFFGLGTGSVRRILDQTYANHGELASDLLRVLFEGGIVGLFLFLGTLAYTLWHHRRNLMLPVLGAYCAALATDMFMVMPAMGFGPLLILAWYAPLINNAIGHSETRNFQFGKPSGGLYTPEELI